MRRVPLLLGGLLALAPVAGAQEILENRSVDVAEAPEEATAGALSTTVVIILIVLAVLVVALIVAMASRP